jgi:Uma2 family endonuclease
MAEPATKPMTLDEFLHWDDGTETRYELIAGFPVAMPVSLEAQRILISRLAGRIEATLSRHASATTLVGVGVVPPDERETFLVADIAATRALIDPWRQTIEEPFLKSWRRTQSGMTGASNCPRTGKSIRWKNSY